MSSSFRTCTRCGAALPADAPPGTCPRCLFALGAKTAGTAPYGEGHRYPFDAPTPAELAADFPQLEILELLGQGGMGAVYKARQRGLDRIVALKILPPDVADDPTFAERFHREARALAKLNHPNVVAIYDSGSAGHYYFFLMEFVDGVTLRQAITGERLSPQEALAVVPQICEALQFAHDTGVVHRDIKPENILLDRQGRVKIADFGLAKLLDQSEPLGGLTGTHQVMGTPRYMAPEQLEGTRNVDHRADLYSLGVVFYEMLTGELPLGRFPPPSKKASIDTRLDDVVLRSLEKEPQSRYQQASEMKCDVESISIASPGFSHRRRRHDYEYRSTATFLGWPLVHIAYGYDARTGHHRVARGWVAIGGTAVGGLAVGGRAFGLIACGGLAIGGISIGGFALGLLAGLGGLATGLAAAGGCAIGGLAVGGIAVGVVGFGGGAFAFFGVGGNMRPRSPFGNPAFPAMEITLVLPALMAISVVTIAALFGIIRLLARRPATEFDSLKEKGPVPPPFVEPPRSRPVSVAAGCLAIALGLALIVGLPLLVLSFTWVRSRSQVATPAVAYAAPRPPMTGMTSLSPEWTYGENGPEITPQFAMLAGLHEAQRQQINEAFAAVYQEFLALEEQHTQRKVNELGHQEITLKPFPGPASRLENTLWTKLDEVLNRSQQELFRRELRLHPVEISGANAIYRLGPSDSPYPTTHLPAPIRPGLFGWARHGARLEIWGLGTWRYWKIATQGSEHEAHGPELPPELQRFWKPTAEQTTAESPTPGPGN